MTSIISGVCKFLMLYIFYELFFMILLLWIHIIFILLSNINYILNYNSIIPFYYGHSI